MSEEKRTCSTCHSEIKGSGHLCDPIEKEGDCCDWCGVQIVNPRHMCKNKVAEISYVCNSCGRTAVNPESLCIPDEIN